MQNITSIDASLHHENHMYEMLATCSVQWYYETGIEILNSAHNIVLCSHDLLCDCNEVSR